MARIAIRQPARQHQRAHASAQHRVQHRRSHKLRKNKLNSLPLVDHIFFLYRFHRRFLSQKHRDHTDRGDWNRHLKFQQISGRPRWISAQCERLQQDKIVEFPAPIVEDSKAQSGVRADFTTKT